MSARRHARHPFRGMIDPRMTNTFACPECGQRVDPTGIPGRQLRCPGCATLLEVPYLPRTTAPKRRSRRAARRRAARLLAIAAAGLIVLIAGGLLLAQRTRRRQVDDAITAGLQAVESAAAEGRHAEAARQAAAVLELAQRRHIPPPAGLAQRRADSARRAARQVMESLPARPPAEAVAAATTLRDEARADDALSDLLGPIGQALAAARERAAESDLSAGRRELEAGRPAAALKHAGAARSAAVLLADSAAATIARQADDLAEALAARYGVVADPVAGRWFLGSTDEFRTLLIQPTLEALRGRGYLTAPDQPPDWQAIWSKAAPNRLHIEVDEEAIPYLQSASRATKLTVRLSLTRDHTLIQNATINAQTRIPPPGMGVYEAGVIATAPRRSPSVEQRLRRDAIDQIRERLGVQFASLPPP